MRRTFFASLQKWASALAFSSAVVLTAGDNASLEADFNGKVPNAAGGAGLVPPLPTQGELQYGAGIRYDALSLAPGQDLSFPAKGNIDASQGTLSFWIKPVDWGNQSDEFIPIWYLGAKKAGSWSYVLYYAKNKGAQFGELSFRSFCQGREYAVSDAQSLKGGKLEKGKWTQVVLSWNSQENKLYLDGKQTGRYYYGLTVQMPPPKADDVIGFLPSFFWSKQHKMASCLDEIKILPRALTDGEVAKLYKTDSSALELALRPPALPAPKSRQPVILDGKLTEGEWDDATKVLLSRKFASKEEGALEAWFLVKHDDSSLHLAFDVPHDADYLLPAPAGRQVSFSHDGAVFGGDEVEFECFQPGAATEDATFQFAVAPNGAWACRKGDDWTFKTQFRFQVARTSERWTAELEIPFAELGVPPGQEAPLAANFGLHRPTAEILGQSSERWLAWGCGGMRSITQKESMGRIHLQKDGTSIRFSKLGSLPYGNLDLQMDASGGQPLSATVKIVADDGEVALDEANLPLDGKGVSIRRTLDWLKRQGMFTVKAFRKDGGDPLFDYSSLFYVRDPLGFEFTCLGDKLEVKADLRGLKEKWGAELKGGKLRLLASLVGTDGVIYAKAESVPRLDTEILLLPFRHLPVGKYNIRLSVQNGQDKIERSQVFERPDPSFLVDRKGLERFVPAPWTPIRKEGNVLHVLNRSYEFGKGPFPVKAWSAGQSLLASEPQVKIVSGGKEMGFSPVRSLDIECSADRFVSEGLAECKGLGLFLKWRRCVDYDGLIRCDLSLVPIRGEVKVDSFTVEMSVPSGVAKYALTPKIDATYNVEWNRKPQVELSGFPQVWLTNEDAGLCLFTDTDANWVYPKDSQPIYLAKTGGDSARISARIIQSPVSIYEEVPYVFGLMATPAKPLPKGWRKLHDGGWTREKGQTLQMHSGWEQDFWFECVWLYTRFLNPEKAKANIKSYSSKGIASMPYGCGNAMPTNNSLYDYYGTQWEAIQEGRKFPKYDRYRWAEDGQEKFSSFAKVCPHSGFADYLTYYTDRFMANYDLVGLYLDFGTHSICDSPEHGCRKKDLLREGRIPISYNTFAIRDMYGRLYKIIHAHKPDGYLFTHQWDEFVPAVQSFVDIVNPGEEFMHSAPMHPEVYMSETPLEKWQSVYRSQTLGSVVQFLGQCCGVDGVLKMERKLLYKRSRPLLACCLLHDIPCGGGQYTEVEPVWGILDRNDISSAEFRPYWQQDAIKSDDPKVLVSYYEWKGTGRKLVLLGNWNAGEKAVTLRFSDCTPKKKVVDEESGLPVDLSQPVSIQGYDFRILGVQ